MTGYTSPNATEITDSHCEIETSDDTRTIIIRGVTRQSPIAAAVRVDKEGRSLPSDVPFRVSGVDNFEAACAAAAKDESGSYQRDLESDCMMIAEEFVRQLDE